MNQLLVVALLGCLCAANAQMNPSVLARGTEFPDKTKWTPFTCRPNGVFTPSNERMQTLGPCKMSTENNECVSKCQSRALGLINADGTTTPEIYEQWVMASFPEQHKMAAKAHFNNCFEKFGRVIDLNEPTCKTANAFGACTWNVMPLLKCTTTAV